MNEDQIFHVIGNEGFTKLVSIFYRKMREDDLIGPMYPQNDWEGSEERLLGFLLFRFGGDMTYIEQRGHPRLRMRHSPFTIGTRERDRWTQIMNESLEECAFPILAAAPLKKFFTETADFLRNQPELPGSCPIH